MILMEGKKDPVKLLQHLEHFLWSDAVPLLSKKPLRDDVFHLTSSHWRGSFISELVGDRIIGLRLISNWEDSPKMVSMVEKVFCNICPCGYTYRKDISEGVD